MEILSGNLRSVESLAWSRQFGRAEGRGKKGMEMEMAMMEMEEHLKDRMTEKKYLLANPLIVLREEFDDWAILFDPDTGKAFGLNPVGVFIWKLLDGKHSIPDILVSMQESVENVPPEAQEDLEAWVQELVNRGLAGYEMDHRA
jgi:SynChlorMet cassette protein ScmD